MKLNDRIIKLTIWKSTKESRNKCESDWNIQEGLTADTASSSLLSEWEELITHVLLPLVV